MREGGGERGEEEGGAGEGGKTGSFESDNFCLPPSLSSSLSLSVTGPSPSSLPLPFNGGPLSTPPLPFFFFLRVVFFERGGR